MELQKTFTLCISVQTHRSKRKHICPELYKVCVNSASVHARSYLLLFCLFVPFNNNFDMRWPSGTTRLERPVENQIKRTPHYSFHFSHSADTHMNNSNSTERLEATLKLFNFRLSPQATTMTVRGFIWGEKNVIMFHRLTSVMIMFVEIAHCPLQALGS